MEPLTEASPAARVAVIRGSRLVEGETGLEVRAKKAQQFRRSVFLVVAALLAMPAVFPAISLAPQTGHWEDLVVVEAAMLVALPLVFWDARTAPFFANNRFYSPRIPLRTLWDRDDLGSFPASDVERVLLRRGPLNDMEWLEVEVEARDGTRVRFVGFSRASLDAAAQRSSLQLAPPQKAELLEMSGGAEDILDWARQAGVRIEEATSPPASPPMMA